MASAMTAFPPPINWFMNVAILQRGELEIREPLAEKDDYVVLRALKDVIAAVSACPQDLVPTNGSNPTDLAVRVYRDAPLPPLPGMDDGNKRRLSRTRVEASWPRCWSDESHAPPRPAARHRRSDGLPRRKSEGGRTGEAGLIVRSHGEAPATAGAVSGASH